MKTLFILHDSFGGPLQDWIPWIRMTFEQAGHKVVVPNFPTPVGQSRQSWHVVLEGYREFLGKDTIVVGFGTGGTCWLRELEAAQYEVLASIFVATPISPSPHIGYSKANESFIADSFKWDVIRNNGGAKALLYGSDDQLITKNDENVLGEALGIEPFVIEGAGHFTVGSGYTQFIQLADLITGIIAPKTEIPPAPKAQAEEAPVPEKPSILSMSYYQDMARVMKTNAGDVMSGVLKTARSKKEQALAINPSRPKNIAYTLSALVLVFLSIACIGYLGVTLLKSGGPVATGPTMLSSLIRKDSETIVDLSGKEPYEIEDLVLSEATKKGTEGTLSETVFTSNKVRLSFQSAYSLISGEAASKEIVSYLNLPWMYGHWYKNSDSQVPFILLSVKSYDGVFFGLSMWEPTLPQDLGIFFGLSEEIRKNPNTHSWQEVLVQNRILRKLISEESVLSENSSEEITPLISDRKEPDLYTGFLSDSLLVITTDPDIFTELNRRIADEQFLK